MDGVACPGGMVPNTGGVTVVGVPGRDGSRWPGATLRRGGVSVDAGGGTTAVPAPGSPAAPGRRPGLVGAPIPGVVPPAVPGPGPAPVPGAPPATAPATPPTGVPGRTRGAVAGPGVTAGVVAITGALVASEAGTCTRLVDTGRRPVMVGAATAVIAPGTPACE